MKNHYFAQKCCHQRNNSNGSKQPVLYTHNSSQTFIFALKEHKCSLERDWLGLLDYLYPFKGIFAVEVCQLWIKIRPFQSKLLWISVNINLMMVITIHFKCSMPTTLMTQLTVVNLAEAGIVMHVGHSFSCFSKDKCFTAYVSVCGGLWHWNRARGTWYPHKWLLLLSVNSQSITSSCTEIAQG